MGFGIKHLIAIRAGVLSLLLMVALFVYLPVVFSGEPFVAGSAVISLLDFQLAFSLPSAGFLCWYCAVSGGLVGGRVGDETGRIRVQGDSLCNLHLFW